MNRFANRFAWTALAALVGAAACGERARTDTDTAAAARTPGAEAETGGERPGGAPAVVSSVGLASFSDSARAATMRDSLARAGWTSPFVTRATVKGATHWRVHVLPTASAELAALVSAALERSGRDVVSWRGETPAGVVPVEIEAFRVNHGTKGMIRSVRWRFSPDHDAILVVEDPVSIEAEPLPDGFLYASEDGPSLVQRDSVWDVAPSPDWTWLAWGRAYLSRPGERETLSDAEWSDLARRAGLSVEETRRRAFPTSGMSFMYGVAIPMLERIGESPATSGSLERRRVEVGAGWRAGWTGTGALAAFGTAPTGVQDDAPATSWILVDPVAGVARDTVRQASDFADESWEEGPTLDISIPFDLARRRTIPLEGDAAVVSEQGWIRLRDGGGAGSSAGRIVGPGAALAATATGRFILALTIDPAAREHESPYAVVVYQVMR